MRALEVGFREDVQRICFGPLKDALQGFFQALFSICHDFTLL